MAKGSNQKLKLLYLMKILLENTDDEHALSMREIIAKLAMYGVLAERKSIYDDLACLEQYGLEIIGEQKNRTYYYHIGARDFELPELKLLVDSVQSAKFITSKKSNELIRKIGGLASHYEAKKLQRQVYVTKRVKTMNENIYLSVDTIHHAIATNHKISFQYFQWNVKKEMELRHGGSYYCVSPWSLSWEDENYYLVGYDDRDEKIKHYRVDKMLHISEKKEQRDGRQFFEKFDLAAYSKKMFAMYDGEELDVRLECENSMAGVMIDRFGRDIMIIPVDDSHFAFTVKIAVSMQFIHWVMALGEKVTITAPDSVVDIIRKEITQLQKKYM